MFKLIFALFLVMFNCIPVQAGWIKLVENDRSVVYASNQAPETKQGSKISWVLYSYKDLQTSPRSGRQYFSEKSQVEIDCSGKRTRTIFYIWTDEPMGDGIVVYTGRKPSGWDPTTAPKSFGYSFWNFFCDNRNPPWITSSTSKEDYSVESVASAIVRETNAKDLSDKDTLSHTAMSYGKDVVFTSILRYRRNLSNDDIDKFKNNLNEYLIPETCKNNSGNIYFTQKGLRYIFEYITKYNQKLAEVIVDNDTCGGLK